MKTFLHHVSRSCYTNMTKSIKITDPEIFDLLNKETNRQVQSINLIASENYPSNSVYQSLGSTFQNKYSEGLPGARYYGGTEFIDEVELLAQKRALELFKLDPLVWGVNVQSLSGSPANMNVYNAFLNIGEKAMGLKLSCGGVY